jgi:hypothetical protein
LSLPDLGASFSVSETYPPSFTPHAKSAKCAKDSGRKELCVLRELGVRQIASEGRITVAPGDYVLARESTPSPSRLASAQNADIAPYCAPPPNPPSDYKPWPPSIGERAAELRKRFASRPEANLVGRKVRLKAVNYAKGRYFNARRMVDFEALAEAFPNDGRMESVVLRGKALAGRPEPVEVAFTLADGSVWGTTVTFAVDESAICISAEKLKHFSSWDKLPDPPPGSVPNVADIVNASFAIGLWLDPSAGDVSHGVEIMHIGGR